jgi:hypothetical protein
MISEHRDGYTIYPVCGWQDDVVQLLDIDFRGGANKPSLREARENYKAFGANSPASVPHARAPTDDEKPKESSRIRQYPDDLVYRRKPKP